MKWIMALFMVLAATPLSAKSGPTTIDSPSHLVSVTVTTDEEGHATYSIKRGDAPVVAPSKLGFLLTDAPQIFRNLEIVRVLNSQHDESWEQPWGEWRSIRNKYRELKVFLREKSPLRRELTVVFRVFDDGVGFRYEFPEQPNLKQVNIAEELTQFAIAEPATAWWAPAFESNREEYLYNRTPIAEIGIAQTPLTLKTTSGLYISLHEAALVDYSGMNIAKVTGGLLKAVLTPSAIGPKVSRAAPFPTPWRVLMIATSAPALYMANPLILNLNEPNKLGDVSWVHPRKFVGIWWGMHLDRQSWASGPKHGATNAYARQMIDFAAANGFTGLLVEGWNKGWDGDWFANGEDFSFTQAYDDFDLKAVTDYGRKKGVALIGHHETSANAAHYESQMDAAFALDHSLGIDSVKTGYVSDAGGFKVLAADGRIVYDWHEGQASARHHLKVVETAARYHVAIDAHEPIKDTGLRRTYPNWVSREGQRGMEYNAWGSPKNPPEHEANLIFTRMLGGPMDFTPGILSLKGRGDSDILSTAAKQLALYVVIYSPIQMVADLPENYAKYPELVRFIRDVPTDWADTRVLNGEIGNYATIVRKDRHSEDWFLGSVTDERARTLVVSLDFLTPGKHYIAEIYRDGADADFRTEKRHSTVVEHRAVGSTDTMALALAPGGGQAIRFKLKK